MSEKEQERYERLQHAYVTSGVVELTKNDIQFLEAYDIACLEMNMDRRDIPVDTYINIHNRFAEMHTELTEYLIRTTKL